MGGEKGGEGMGGEERGEKAVVKPVHSRSGLLCVRTCSLGKISPVGLELVLPVHPAPVLDVHTVLIDSVLYTHMHSTRSGGIGTNSVTRT